MTTAPHSLAAGNVLPMEYQEMLGGFSGVAMPCDPAQSLMLILGRSGCGKSTFLRSCPNAFIVNADCSSSSEISRASVWPAVRYDGTPVSLNPRFPKDPEKGTPIGGLDWPKIQAKKQVLIDLAAKDIPGRPTLIGLDTLDLAYKMVQEHMIAERNLELAANGNTLAKDFGDLFGKTAWPESYRHITDFVFDLRRAGYGVAVTLHLGDKAFYEGDSKKLITDTPLVPDNLWHGLYKHAELVCCIEKKIETYTVPVPMKKPNGEPVMLPNGQPRMMSRAENTIKHFMTFESPILINKTKKRDDLPDFIEIPKNDPWGAWKTVYESVRTKS